MLWFGSWLNSAHGDEGAWFYSGRGAAVESYPVPPGATGLRIRRWPNEGLDAEYADISPLGTLDRLDIQQLDFDAPQPFSRLPQFISRPQEART